MPQNKIFRFSAFEVDPGGHERRKSRMPLRLQEQPFQALLMRLERPGDVVSRELRQKLWLADSLVGFDHSLNTIINKLREMPGETAPSAPFSETLAKHGSRFLPAVEVAVTNDGDRSAMLSATQTATVWPVKTRQASTSVLTRPEELPPAPQEYVRVLFLLIQVMYLSFYIMAWRGFPKLRRSWQRWLPAQG